jgi:uncharacterized protein
MLELSLEALIYFALAALIVGFTKTSVGGVGILAVVFMALAIPGKASPGVLLPMLVFADVVAVLYYRRWTDWNILARIFPAAALGVVAGYFVVDALPPESFNKVIGATILALVAFGYAFERYKSALASGRAVTGIVGVIAGAASMISNAAGPIFGVYLLQLGLNKAALVGTRAWFFLAINTFKVPFSVSLGLINADTLTANLMAVPLILLGAWLGYRFLKLLNVEVFNLLVRLTAIVAGIRLLIG